MSLGTPEIIIIFVLVLLLFGPSRLPDLARSLGKGMRELRKATSEMQSHLNFLAEDDEPPARNTRHEPRYNDTRHDEPRREARALPPREASSDEATNDKASTPGDRMA